MLVRKNKKIQPKNILTIITYINHKNNMIVPCLNVVNFIWIKHLMKPF